MSHESTNPKPTPEDVQQRMADLDGVNGAAGHEITDAETREIIREQAAGEITGDQAREKLRAKFGVD